MDKSRNIYRVKRAFILSFLTIVISSSARLQNTTVVTIEPYKPTISDAFKINENPKITDTTVEKISPTYTVNPKLYKTSFKVEPIKAAKITGDPLVKFYKSYIKAGFGNKTTPLAEFYFNNLRSTERAVGIYYRHFSSSGKIKDYAFPRFSDNEAAIYASKFYKYHSLSGKVDYNRNVYHYYGFPDSLEENQGIKKDSIKQRFYMVGGQLKFKSTYRDSSKLNHSFFLRYSYLSDLYSASESNVVFRGTIDKGVKFLGKSIASQDIGLKTNVDYNNDLSKVDTSWGAAILLLPHISASYDVLKFDLGCNIFVKAADETKLKPFPNVNIDINLYNNVFILYAGITSNLERNSLKSFSDENPFINTALPDFQFTHTRSKFYAGFKGCMSSYLSFNAGISISKIDKLPLYVTDTTLALRNKFAVIYDDADVFNSHTEITYQKSEKIKIMPISDFYQYHMTNEISAWHKPGMNLKLAFNYNLKDKIIVKTDIFAVSKTKAKTYGAGINPIVIPVELKGTVDFNLGLEYRYSKILSAFLNFNNVGAVRYKQWYNYPTYGFNVLGGVTYAF